MRIAGSHFFPFDCEKTYRSLHDPAISIRCLPDFESLERAGEDAYVVTVRLALANLSGLFAGTIEIIDPHPSTSFKILVAGDLLFDKVRGEGTMHLKPWREGTELTYDGDVQVGATIAAVGQRILDATAKMMIRKFFEKFIEEVRNHP